MSREQELMGLLRRWMSDEARDNPHAIYVASEAALSQQVESECTCPSGDGSLKWPCPAHACAEPDPAQDEQYPPCDFCGVIPDHHPWHGSGMFKGFDSPHIHACNDCRHLLPSRPAQTEQQPVSWQFYQDGKWWNGGDRIKDHRKNTEAAGIPVRDLYAAPIAQTEQQPARLPERISRGSSEPNQIFADGWNECLDEVVRLNAAPIAQTAPQQGVQLADTRRSRIYLAGPMTGIADYNFPAFNAEADRLREQGYHVENPADHGVVEGADWADYLRYDIGRLATCECIHLLPGWSQSSGAKLEVSIAKALGMHFLYAEGAETAPQPEQSVLVEAAIAALSAVTAERDARDWEMKAQGIESVIHLVVSKHDQEVLRRYADDKRAEGGRVAPAMAAKEHGTL